MIKKIFAIMISAVIACTCTAVAAMDNETEVLPFPTYEAGDVNMDSVINIRDATMIQKHIASLIALTINQLKYADVDYDGTVNIKDATFIQKLIAGLAEPIKPTDSPDRSTEAVTDTTEDTDAEETPTQPETEEMTTSEAQETDPEETTTATEEVTEDTQATDSTEATQPTQQTTKDPDKPIELPFIPV